MFSKQSFELAFGRMYMDPLEPAGDLYLRKFNQMYVKLENSLRQSASFFRLFSIYVGNHKYYSSAILISSLELY